MIRCAFCGRFVRSEMLIVWGTSGEAKLRCHRLACLRARDRELASATADRKGCCGDAQMCLDEGEAIILHTFGCVNRCGVKTPIAVPSARRGYPCGLSREHEGRHWVPDGYMRAE